MRSQYAELLLAGRKDRVRRRVRAWKTLVRAAEAREAHSQSHGRAVSRYAGIIARRMRLAPGMIRQLCRAARLHDLGKIAVPEAILTKPGPLTPEEFAVVQRHPRQALEILGEDSLLSEEGPMILHHHERYDGGGYPAGLAGNRIPLGARILAVADAIEVMLSPRSYKPAFDMGHARAEILAGRGKQFDPQVSDAALACLDETSKPPKVLMF